MNNDFLGYNEYFEEQRIKNGFGDFSIARVTSESKGGYKVRNENGEFFATITGKQMFHAQTREDYPAVGDWVAITENSDDRATIHGVLPRATILKRIHGDKNRSGEKSDVQVIATNIDVAFVVESVDRDYSLNRFERYFAIAQSGGVRPVIVLNKIDLLSDTVLQERLNELKNRFPMIDIIPTSVASHDSLVALRTYLEKGKTYCFLGSSGVGKSSLINTLIGEAVAETGEISSYSDRGKHVTTRRQMYLLENGSIVIDNPGIREVGMTDVRQGVEGFFDDIVALANECKYVDCTHVHEPECAVREAVASGTLDAEKYSNYIGLKKEVEYYEMSDLEKRNKDKQFGKFIKSAKKSFKEYGE